MSESRNSESTRMATKKRFQKPAREVASKKESLEAAQSPAKLPWPKAPCGRSLTKDEVKQIVSNVKQIRAETLSQKSPSGE